MYKRQDLSFAALFIGIFLANLGLRFLFMMLGISVHSGDFRPIMKENKPKVVGFGRH